MLLLAVGVGVGLVHRYQLRVSEPRLLYHIRQLVDGLRVVSEVQHELLPSTDALQVGVASITPPAFAVGMVGEGRLVAVGVEPWR